MQKLLFDRHLLTSFYLGEQTALKSILYIPSFSIQEKIFLVLGALFSFQMASMLVAVLDVSL